MPAACNYARAGENALALDWLEKAFETRDPNLPYLGTPNYDSLRSEPRYQWRDIADGTVQADVVVMLDVTLHQTPRICNRQRRSRPDALPFERFVPPFD